MGLTVKNNQQVCCKVKRAEQYPAVVLPDGLVIPGFRSTCTQETIPNPQGNPPGQVCRCYYRNQKDVSVYDWHTGECCWCDVYIGWVTNPSIADSDVRYHTKFYVKCEKNPSLDFTAETTPATAEIDSIRELIIGGVRVLPQIKEGGNMNLKGYSWSHKGRISCKNAEQAKMIASADTYWSVRHNCWIWAHEISNTVLDLCP
ncbi:MAG TPA: hypothetical protein PKY88_00835 [Anaerohalosphaeraceae bacterium]|nr:hypothetical protein [Anaerohalosphaeraceae bacterium]